MTTDKRAMIKDYLTILIRLIVGGIFIYASIDKIVNPGQFARIVYNYHLLPSELVNVFALILPWVEFICGLAIILGIYYEGSVLIMNLMVLSFIIALGINYFRGVSLECGCFTVSSKAKGAILDLLIRDFGLIALTLFLYFSDSERFRLFKKKWPI
jgi:uncharacterized membrane protein YphA (DoxX/SURF4 family)